MMRSNTWLVALTLAALYACETVQTTQGGAVGVERKQSMSPLVSSAQMDRSAADAYAQVLADARKKDQLNRDPAQLGTTGTTTMGIAADTGTPSPVVSLHTPES